MIAKIIKIAENAKSDRIAKNDAVEKIVEIAEVIGIA